MNKQNTKALLETYPKIFRQHTLPMTQTAMCWLFECGDGWYKLLDELCDNIQNHIDKNNLAQVEATQVKEKWGTLRFYTNGSDDYVYDLISSAEEISGKICEICGSKNNVTLEEDEHHWVRTRCNICKKIK
mgnify:CR=1 FL=1